MKELSFLIKPASSLCNMACRYCFYADVSEHRVCQSMGIMTQQVSHALIDQAFRYAEEKIHFCFQGGEPLMAGLAFFEDFVAYVQKQKSHQEVTYAIQTNGLAMDEKWVDFFRRHHFLVGVSLDGFLKNHNRFRPDRQGKGTFTTIMHHIKQLEKKGVEYNILTVLTHALAKSPDQLFDSYLANDFRYVQLIPCLPELDSRLKDDHQRLTPKDFAQFYCRFFDRWFEAYQKGNYISVTLFDNVIPMYLRVPPSQCGMLGRCQMQLVIEGNGNVYPCDFYVLDEYLCGNIAKDDLLDIIHSAAGKNFVEEKRTVFQGCKDCAFQKMCYGNCKRLAVCYYDDHYCGYQEFLRYSQKKMWQIAQNLVQNGER